MQLQENDTPSTLNETPADNTIIVSTNIFENIAKELVSNNITFFENILITTIIRKMGFWFMFCKDKVNLPIYNYKKVVDSYKDFSNQLDNDIFTCLSEYYQVFDVSDEKDDPVMGKSILLSIFTSKVKDMTYTEEDLEYLHARLNDLSNLLNLTSEEFLYSYELVKAGFYHWLELRRVSQTSHKLRNKHVTADEMIDTLKQATKGVSGRDDIKLRTLLSHYETDKDAPLLERMPVPTLPMLTEALNGGPALGECGLIAIASGRGKTIIACQLAVGLAMSGKNVLFITTEQEDSMLIPRMVSASLNIEFSKISDGIVNAERLDLINTSERKQIYDWSVSMGSRIQFANWTNKGQYTIKNDLEKQLNKWEEQLDFKPDAIIFDWILGGMDFKENESDRKRQFMQSSANIFEDICKRHKIFGCMTAQLNKDQAKKVRYISSSELMDCKSLDENFSWALGISSLTVHENKKRGATDNINIKKETYLTHQTANLWKNRKSPDTNYPVKCEFEYQRFVELSQYQNNDTQTMRPNLSLDYKG